MSKRNRGQPDQERSEIGPNPGSGIETAKESRNRVQGVREFEERWLRINGGKNLRQIALITDLLITSYLSAHQSRFTC
jgi:hypothetical protein